MVTGELSVAEAALALGTSARTVRAMLRSGTLTGASWSSGSQVTWVVHRESVESYLRAHGRSPVIVFGPPVSPPPSNPPTQVAPPGAAPRGRWRLPWFLRVRGRATVIVLLVGVPALIAYLYARVAPGALWFEEMGQQDLFRRLVEARVDFHLRVLVVVAGFIAANLVIAYRGSVVVRRLPGLLAIAIVSVVLGNLFASAATSHLPTYLLWRHRQPFGETDPLSGKDIGFFVFSLPFYLELALGLLVLLGLTLAIVLIVYRVRRLVVLWPLRIDPRARLHLAGLVAALLVVVAWRLQLQEYVLELGQPSARDPQSFAGASYVEVTATMPILRGLSGTALVLALTVLIAPLILRGSVGRTARILAVDSVIALAVVAALVAVIIPPALQRYVVDPNPLVREEPYLANSLHATRAALGLDEIDVNAYEPDEEFDAADFADEEQRFKRVPAWDAYVLGARMRQLVTDTPYYRPEDPVPDVVATPDGRRLTAVSARELDLGAVPDGGDGWVNDRLAYTHGLGLVRFSSTDIGRNREPLLLDSGLGVEEPRIYFGDLPDVAPSDIPTDGEGSHAASNQAKAASQDARLLDPTLDANIATSPWVIANTRRPEVDVVAPESAGVANYHYDGPGGIPLSSNLRRAAFALALGSMDLMLSDEITPDSRLLLHRDVHDRLETLAPFIHWDSEAVPLTANGHVVYVVDGYSTSSTYPYAENVMLGRSEVNYARASVLATVDAFTGKTTIHVVDEEEPVLRAWREIFPSLFHPFSELPEELHGRLRYPNELFIAQATAYERFHTTRPDVFASGADEWSRPLALSGPIEVAGDINFDESDEDDLRLTMPPVYIWIPPKDGESPRIVLATYYTPAYGQNLVGGLNGWIDDQGRTQLSARTLDREPVTLGPAQVSRLVFAEPRVSNLLGLRNLEIRDLDKSSIDSVLLGRPRILFLQGGVVQVQNLYEGSRGPGAARLLGVTAYVNGRAGLGPDAPSAVRQAINDPPIVEIAPPADPVVVGDQIDLAFHVDNARRERVRITSPTGEVRATLRVPEGTGSVSWVPTEAGPTQVRVTVLGLDGTRTSDTITVDVLGPPPEVELLDAAPTSAMVGAPVSVRFRVTNGISARAEVSTDTGIVFSRRYRIRNGVGVVSWVPDQPGPARLVVTVRGTEGQRTRTHLRIEVADTTVATPPTVTLVDAPRTGTVGEEALFVFSAEGCGKVRAQLTDPEGVVVREWRVTCPAEEVELRLTPDLPGRYTLTVRARGAGASSQFAVPLTVREPS